MATDFFSVVFLVFMFFVYSLCKYLLYKTFEKHLYIVLSLKSSFVSTSNKWNVDR